MPSQPQSNACIIRPATGKVYNFTDLVSPNADYALKNHITNETVRFQLCHELHNECNGAGGYAACLEYGEKHIAIGEFMRYFWGLIILMVY